MGILGFGKKKQTPEELGEYYYKLSLRHDLDEWAYVCLLYTSQGTRGE